MRLGEAGAVDEQVVARGFVGTEGRIAALRIVDDRGETRGPEGRRDRAAADPVAEDGGRVLQAPLEAVGEVAHRSLRDRRPSRPKRKERIQKRATTLVEAQPFFWKW